MTSNLPASIRARLKQTAAATNADFNLVLTRYALERLLYRLSVSQHASMFVLKGALLFHVWYDAPHRPTRDADLLGFGSDDVPTMEAVFREIASIAADDGIVFDPSSVGGSETRQAANYGGVRIALRASLDGARIAVQIDIGFGDAVTPAHYPIKYPTILSDLPAAVLRAYPKATAIAEKLHAITALGLTNTRMKDFYDLVVLLKDKTLERPTSACSCRSTE